jgi:hypothetical protein
MQQETLTGTCFRPNFHSDDFSMLGVSDGLFVLDKTYNADDTICVVNPITNSTLRFAAQKPHERRVNVVVTVSEPLLVFSSCCCRIGDVCADPTIKLISVAFSPADLAASKVRSMVAYGGYVYMVHENGPIFQVGGTAQNCHADLATYMFGLLNLHDAGKKVCLLESAGDLIVVVRRFGGPMMQVFKLDVDRKVLEAVESLPGCAFFIDDVCMSVNAAKILGVDDYCIYHTASVARDDKFAIFRYDIFFEAFPQ